MPTEDDNDLSRLEEAALWLGRLETGDADRRAFERWRGDPANAVAFVKVSATSEWFDQNRSALDTKMMPASRPGITRRWWAGVAAASVAVAAAGIGTFSLLGGRASAHTGIGERSSLSLPDGGRLDLNTDSKASWKFGPDTRSVWVERGEVSLNVVADQRPLLVRAKAHSLWLAPGEYYVRLKGDEVEIAIAKGEAAILISEGKSATSLKAGDLAELHPDKAASIRSADANALAALSAWRNDELVLDGVTLSAAVLEYNRYLKAKIVLEDSADAHIRLGGRFTTKDPTEFLKALETSFGIKARKAPDGTLRLGV